MERDRHLNYRTGALAGTALGAASVYLGYLALLHLNPAYASEITPETMMLVSGAGILTGAVFTSAFFDRLGYCFKKGLEPLADDLRQITEEKKKKSLEDFS